MRAPGPVSLLLVAAAAACANTGLGDAVRKDVADRMQTVEQPIAACYEAALVKNRKLRGEMTLAFVAAAKTGKFTDVRVTRNDLAGDPELDKCVVDQVSALALARPQKSQTAVTYPLDFAPIEQKK